VLVDLSHAADGYVGIAQDIRLIFAMLAELDNIQLTGLLMPVTRHSLPFLRADHPDLPGLTASILHLMERNWAPAPLKHFPLLVTQLLQMLGHALRSGHPVLPVTDRGLHNAIWRVLFGKTLLPEQRARVIAQAFAVTDLSVRGIIERCAYTTHAVLKKLDARDYDAVLFAMPRPVRLPAAVWPVMRFHDAVPVTDPDTVQGIKMVLTHTRLIRNCPANSVFVCNSPQSREALLAIDPAREKKAVVIPCAITPARAGLTAIDPVAVIERNMTWRALGPGTGGKPEAFVAPTPGLRYILSVSTLEPRKNFSGLIRAFEQVSAHYPDVRLVIVAGPGWGEEDALRALRPGVARGKILHLQNVPTEELHALMRHAACFALPSFNEGFGYTPIEAMQFATPCVVSDIPVFRWIFGEAAIFVDPYNPDSIADGIRRTLETPGLREAVAAGAEGALARFGPDAVRGEWQNLFANLKQFV
jgi:glycosyltransferase involved in cell wall biosynthesis